MPTEETEPDVQLQNDLSRKSMNAMKPNVNGDEQREIPIEPQISLYYSDPRIKPLAFCKCVRKAKIKIFDADDMSKAIQELEVADPTLVRTVSLVGKGPDPINKWIARATKISLDHYMPGASSNEDMSPNELFGRIVQTLSEHLSDKDKARRTKAQNFLRLALNWLVDERNLKPDDALLSVRKIKSKKAPVTNTGVHAATVRLVKIAKLNHLHDLALIANYFEAIVEEKTKDARQTFAQLSKLGEDMNLMEMKLNATTSDLEIAKRERIRLSDQLCKVEKQLDEQKKLRELDERTRNGQFRGFLEDRLKPPLSDALDALEFIPPNATAAVQRINMAMKAVRSRLEKPNE